MRKLLFRLLATLALFSSASAQPFGPGPTPRGVPSIGGTANQINQSGSPLATILSLSSTIVVPGTITIPSGGLILNGTTGALTVNCAASCGTNTLTLPGGTTDFSATGGTSQVVKQTSTGAALTVGRLACADLSNAGTGCSGTLGSYLPLTGGTMTGSLSLFGDTKFLDSASGTIFEMNGTTAGRSQPNYTGNIPTCGTGCASVAAGSTDASFNATSGAVVSAVTVNFANTWAAAPNCVVSTNSLVGFGDIAAVSTTAVTFGLSAALSGAIIYVHCSG